MYKLRGYQGEAVKDGLQTFKNKSKDVLVLPTGSGKSLVVACVAKELPGKTIVFQPNKEILAQNLQKMHDFGFTDTGVFSASMGQKTIGKVTFSTIGTIYNKPDMWGVFDNIIVDEAHLCNAKGGMYEKFISTNGGAVLGLTATPYRLHSYNDHKTGDKAVVAKMLNRTRPKIFKSITHVTQIKDMYDLGFLCPVRYTESSEYNHSEIKLNSTGMDFNDNSLKLYNENIGLVEQVAQACNCMVEQGIKHILVFNKFVEEAEEVEQKLKRFGIKAKCISAKTKPKERAQILSDFKSGILQVVSNVGVLTTGFDFPGLDCVILARPTQSVALYYQMVGRGVRICGGKNFLDLIDLCGNVGRFGKIESFEIIPAKPKSKLLRLKSDASFLTGYDFVGNKDLENIDYKGYKEGPGNNEQIVFVGKWRNNGKGTHISKIDNGYMEWAVKNFDNGKLKALFVAELERRV